MNILYIYIYIAGRCNNHQLFLKRYISENIIPNELKLELKPTIGNHGEYFLNKWYIKLQQYNNNNVHFEGIAVI